MGIKMCYGVYGGKTGSGVDVIVCEEGKVADAAGVDMRGS